jgi:Chemotaxis signal transduction protein
MEVSNSKYLTFLLNEEDYGIPIQDVKEIIRMMDITGIPKTPKFLKGVINLRGKIIPVIDLRIKFGLEEREYTQRTCIIVVEVLMQGVKKIMGVIVDTVSEVIGINKEEIDRTSDEDSYFEEEFIEGLAKVKGKVVILLEVEKILNNQELFLLNNETGGTTNV